YLRFLELDFDALIPTPPGFEDHQREELAHIAKKLTSPRARMYVFTLRDPNLNDNKILKEFLLQIIVPTLAPTFLKVEYFPNNFRLTEVQKQVFRSLAEKIPDKYIDIQGLWE